MDKFKYTSFFQREFSLLKKLPVLCSSRVKMTLASNPHSDMPDFLVLTGQQKVKSHHSLFVFHSHCDLRSDDITITKFTICLLAFIKQLNHCSFTAWWQTIGSWLRITVLLFASSKRKKETFRLFFFFWNIGLSQLNCVFRFRGSCA